MLALPADRDASAAAASSETDSWLDDVTFSGLWKFRVLHQKATELSVQFSLVDCSMILWKYIVVHYSIKLAYSINGIKLVLLGEFRRPAPSAWTLSLHGWSSPLHPLAHCGGNLHLGTKYNIL